MKRIFIVFLSFLLLVIIISVISCDAPTDLNPPGDDFSGYIFFVDSNFTFNGGYYAISIYTDSLDLCDKKPFKTDSLNISFTGEIYQAVYKMHGVPPGKYRIASTWVKYPVNDSDLPLVLGTYGCDTNMSCTTYAKLVFPNFTGNYINIKSYADTSRHMY